MGGVPSEPASHDTFPLRTRRDALNTIHTQFDRLLVSLYRHPRDRLSVDEAAQAREEWAKICEAMEQSLEAACEYGNSSYKRARSPSPSSPFLPSKSSDASSSQDGGSSRMSPLNLADGMRATSSEPSAWSPPSVSGSPNRSRSPRSTSRSPNNLAAWTKESRSDQAQSMPSSPLGLSDSGKEGSFSPSEDSQLLERR